MVGAKADFGNGAEPVPIIAKESGIVQNAMAQVEAADWELITSTKFPWVLAKSSGVYHVYLDTRHKTNELMKALDRRKAAGQADYKERSTSMKGFPFGVVAISINSTEGFKRIHGAIVAGKQAPDVPEPPIPTGKQ